MAETWWTQNQAYQYVMANYPCESSPAAYKIIERLLEAGTLSARYRRSDGVPVPIGREEWGRGLLPGQSPPDIEATESLGPLEWSGWRREEERLLAQAAASPSGLPEETAGFLEFHAEPLRRLCASQGATASKSGRPRKAIGDTLRILAGRWIGHNGRPPVRARLEEYLMQVAADHGEAISEDTAERLAREALDVDRSHDAVSVD
jgi:hypothetical protein